MIKETITWYKVGEKAPPCAGSYLVRVKTGAVFITHFHEKTKIFSTKRINSMVTHWSERPICFIKESENDHP